MHLLTKGAWAALFVLFIASYAPTNSCAMEAGDAPESVEIDSLSELYEPVQFDHAMHLDIAECQDCHHHTTGQKPNDDNCLRCHENSGEADSISCADCHAADRFSPQDLAAREGGRIYHIDKPGLKGAYHLNCISCHEENGAPTGCQDCHAMTDKGKEVFQTSIVPPADGHHEHE
ncbi:cytochrome c3 family protein [Desulfogranum japonicum]|uniref:cytochrome c3 family protein n=1 Tax=Desulfogranum japonicum TaxID=231447 RepID=UPI0004279AF8|nr:cytochrome c3 family protein [Desulfogranum japonicum]